ncbi:MAG: hypothetical protein V9G24_16200 [Rhodoblastus sp.]
MTVPKVFGQQQAGDRPADHIADRGTITGTPAAARVDKALALLEA